MINYLFIIGIVIFITIYYIKFIKIKGEVIVKGVRELDICGIILSFSWLLLAFLNLRVFIKYDLNRIRENLDLNYLRIAIIQSLLGIGWVLKSFKINILSQEGIYTKNGKYKWNRVKDYKWSLVKEIKHTKKGKMEYYNLKFRLDGTKLDKWVIGQNNKEISIEIKEYDKEKVEKFLNEKIKEKICEE